MLGPQARPRELDSELPSRPELAEVGAERREADLVRLVDVNLAGELAGTALFGDRAHRIRLVVCPGVPLPQTPGGSLETVRHKDRGQVANYRGHAEGDEPDEQQAAADETVRSLVDDRRDESQECGFDCMERPDEGEESGPLAQPRSAPRRRRGSVRLLDTNR